MDKKIGTKGGELFYRDLGAGMPLLLIHGFAEDSAVWDGVASRLSFCCRLLIPDLPGSGRSALPANNISMETMADTIKGVLDSEDIDRCVLIGHSMGGYIALAFAERYPEHITAWGFFHSTAYADTEEKKANRSKSIEFILQHRAAAFIRQAIPSLFAPETRENRSFLVEAMIGRYSDFNPDALIAYLEAMKERPDRTNVLGQSQTPVLFIIGEKDGLVPVEQSLKQVHLPRIADVHVLPGTGHMGMLEEPAAGAAIIQSFLNFISHL